MFVKSQIRLALLFCLTISLPVFSKEPNYAPGEVLVRFDSTKKEKSQIEASVSSVCNGTVKSISRYVSGLTLVKLPDDLAVEDAITQFKNTPGVLNVQPNFIYRTQAIFPNDANFSQLYGLHNVGQQHPLEGGGTSIGTPNADINAPQAWKITTDSDIIVAVIDTGVDYNHPDLAANMWHNPGEIPGNGIDDDNNGYVDDIYGIDRCPFSGPNPKPRDSDPMDDVYHGTHCAGIIGAIGNNGTGITGVCWNVKIMALKFMGHNGSGLGDGYTPDAIDCIYYAISMGAKVINASWGEDKYSQYNDVELRDAIEAANAAGVLFIAAAGNNSTYAEPWDMGFYPATFDCENIISVLATNDDDGIASISNFGPVSVDLGAPGENIFSTFPTFETDAMAYPLINYSTNYETQNGTSMSAPYVAGACALVWSMKPSLSHLQVKDIILDTVDILPVLEEDLYDRGRLCLTGGRLNLYNAVLAAATNEQIISMADDVNDGNSVGPYNEIIYTITYANPVTDPCAPGYIGTLTNVRIVDYLPEEMTLGKEYMDTNTGQWVDNYNPYARTFTWNIGTLLPGCEPNSVSLTVEVGRLAEPLGTITNLCALRANEIRPVFAVEVTDVNAWNPPVIYVDADATRLNNGMSWENAFRELQDALYMASIGCGSNIYVAGGTYRPTQDLQATDANFCILNGVSMYGGFAGNEKHYNQRNLADPANKTILTGDIQGSGTARIKCPVIANDLDTQTTLDGFEITYATETGLKAQNSSLTFKNGAIRNCKRGMYIADSEIDVCDCTIENSDDFQGVYSQDSNLVMNDCTIQNSNYEGIYAVGSSLNIVGCNIRNNNFFEEALGGIYAFESGISVTDSNIHNNFYGIKADFDSNQSISEVLIANTIIRNNNIYGIHLLYVSSPVEIQNCRIYRNGQGGIYIQSPLSLATLRNNTIFKNGTNGFVTDDSNTFKISNCIIWDNCYEVSPYDANNATYSCIMGTSLQYPGTGNIFDDPCFIDAENNDFHLDTNSPCIDTGDPDFNDFNETDIDGECRIMDGDSNGTFRVDMGADEYYWPKADFNRDEIVNFIDFAIFAPAWLTTNANISLDTDDDVDINDLSQFCRDWLWVAPWSDTYQMLLDQRDSFSMNMAAQIAAESAALIDRTPDIVVIEEPLAVEEPVAAEESVSNTEMSESEAGLTEEQIEENVEWLDQLWLSGGLEGWSEQEYLEFRVILQEMTY